jgi:CRISPR-associated protein Cas6
MIFDLTFPVTGESIPLDHSYPLYAALSGIVPQFHAEESALRFASIPGLPATPGTLQLTEHSHLRVRLPDNQVKVALPLAGKRLVIGESSIRLGVPAIQTLTPAASLIARLVTFKNAETPEDFLTTARAKLAELQINGQPQLPIHLHGPHAGKPKRRIVRIKQTLIVGYSLIVSELSADDSLRLQETGLGGRTKLACGFFVPCQETRS